MRYLVITALFLTACVHEARRDDRVASVFRQAQSVCSVLDNPSEYLGKHVLVRALYLAEPHGRILFDRDCPQGEIAVRPSLVRDDRQARIIMQSVLRRNKTARIPVVYFGVIEADPLIANCSESSCFTYRLEDARLMAARVP